MRAAEHRFAKCVEAVFEAHRGYLLRIAHGVLGSMDEAEDAVQDAFVRVLAAAPDERCIRIGALVMRVKHAALDRYRHRATQTRARAALLQAERPVQGADPGPETALEHARAKKVLWTALARVPAAEREAFEAHDLHGLSYEEAGRSLARSPKTVRQAAYRARGRVRRWLRSHGFTSLADVSGRLRAARSQERRHFEAARSGSGKFFV